MLATAWWVSLFPGIDELRELKSELSQVTYTYGRKCMSILMTPSPWHASQRPPLTLNEKRPG